MKFGKRSATEAAAGRKEEEEGSWSMLMRGRRVNSLSKLLVSRFPSDRETKK